jgi:hypothetical protein
MKKASEDDELSKLASKNEVTCTSYNNKLDKNKTVSKCFISLNECQFCNLSKQAQDSSRKYEEKCLNCAKVLCEKCSILSSIKINKDIQKICLLCKKCSKINDLNLELPEGNNQELNKNENPNKKLLNDEILTIDLQSSQVILINSVLYSQLDRRCSSLKRIKHSTIMF